MSFDLDKFLLDRVFQPVTDALSGFVTCFELARALMYAAILLGLAEVTQRFNENRLDMWDALSIPCLFYITWINLVLLRRAEGGRRSGLMNALRPRMAWQRLCWALMAVASVYWYAVGQRAGSDVTSLLVDLTLACGTYFMACEARPPARRFAASPFAA